MDGQGGSRHPQAAVKRTPATWDATRRVLNLWFGDADEHGPRVSGSTIEIYLAPEVAEQRIAAAVAAGGTVVTTATPARSP